MNLLEPWVLLPLVASLVAALLFLRAAFTSWKVLRHFDVASAVEGQLALERQVELSSTFVRVATAAQVGGLVLTVLAADRLSHGVRGAMCAYGVFHANEWGPRALVATFVVALVAAVVAQVYAFDASLPRPDLVRPLSWLTLAMAPLALVDLALKATFLLGLDLTVTASCCSIELDPVAAGAGGYASGPRALVTLLAPALVVVTVVLALLAAKRPRLPLVVLAAAAALSALPVVFAAVILEVAPYAFELPHHDCPFCLLKADVLGLGYPLFGAIFLAVAWGLGAALSSLLGRRADRRAVEAFVKTRLRREVYAWGIALVLGAAPVARYFLVSDGRSLFP